VNSVEVICEEPKGERGFDVRYLAR